MSKRGLDLFKKHTKLGHTVNYEKLRLSWFILLLVGGDPPRKGPAKALFLFPV